MVIEKDSLLAIVDVQVGSLKPNMQGFTAEIGAFARQWSARGGQVMVFKYVNVPGSPCERFLDWKEMYGPPETNLVPELKAWESAAITRSQYSALTPELKEWIANRVNPTIALCGMDTAACIQKTALDLFEAGIHPFVIADLCASGAGEETHQAAITALKRSIGLRQVGTG